MNRSFFRNTCAAIAVVGLLSASACAADNKETAPVKNSSSPKIFATTGYIGDAVKNVAPDADLTVMVGPGGDPHTYQPSTSDVKAMQEADVVFWSGLGMEANMIDQLKGLGDKQIALAEQIPENMLLPWEEDGDHESHEHEGHGHEGHDHEGHGHEGHSHGAWDPHVWNSTDNWKLVVDQIVKKMSAADPDKADTYKTNGAEYNKKIDETKAYVQEKINTIPADQRTLVSGHDVFRYFGKQSGLEIKATDFVTSDAQRSASELNELAEFIVEHKVPVIFQDASANPQAVKSLEENVAAKGGKVTVSSAELYSDSLGATAPADTYTGALRYNADTIAAAYKG
ncbi:iron ABC transporter substrate-binding protein [Corynebacterium pseudotuberculosis]|uniref:metal ABC transporter solute-binding protein, Zn/Mn family n=1 Tax=Corynebacterium pseudotuberculosis TaxID=1719 RepID=UPI00065E0A9A|nr:zinc ABC transporter substrate-binding protein [Corynebacterium pseudotuberculosis]AFH89967.3 zinc ABC transporter solute-binding protein [Corynebacterium pseudotuberculosis 31]APB10075.1 iron ABC transporter substrate-binding protein [Corynebacterium pseudotuberculosis]APB12121.1 iron ABC transporter substrate-binding protein [Corynebacterium pseudotuberculosis]APB14168.1 iron ABC transporter substrate-binding protein [Corynebacterium pseudotuberculosis]APB16220.1 iron ABC transporter subs